MFEFLYAGSIVQMVKDNPREFLGAAVAVYTISEIASTKKEMVKANAKVRVAELELESTRLKYETAKLFEVEN
jgi:hypothetical protein